MGTMVVVEFIAWLLDQMAARRSEAPKTIRYGSGICGLVNY